MEVSMKRNNALATGCAAGKTHSGAGCFGAAVHETHSLTAWYSLTNSFGKFHFPWGWRAERCAVAGGGHKRRRDCAVRMTQNDRAITLYEVDISTALDIKNMSTFATGNDVWLASNGFKRTN
jgi:hypothetical protein